MTTPERRLVITAAANGIGLAIAELFAANGYSVLIADIDRPAGEAAAKRLGATFRYCDVRDAAQIEDLFAGVDDLAVLVNNAGSSGETRPVTEQDPDQWDEIFRINVKSAFLACRRAVPIMRARGTGTIINVGSIAERANLANRAPYSASKAALSSLTKTLAREVGIHGITVNALLPGSVRGSRFTGVLMRYAATNGISVEEAEQTYLARTSTRRYVEASEIAELALFLASDKTRSLTGQTISVCGGFQ